MLKTAAVRNGRTDRLTGVYTRDAILTTLFRETDRVQRMNTSLCVILFDIDDFGHWNGRLGPAACDDLLVQVTERVGRLLGYLTPQQERALARAVVLAYDLEVPLPS